MHGIHQRIPPGSGRWVKEVFGGGEMISLQIGEAIFAMCVIVMVLSK